MVENISDEKLRKLEQDKLEKLIDWGIQRQLTWSIFAVTAIIALVTLFVEITRECSTSQEIVTWSIVFYVILVIGLWSSMRNYIDYYRYVAKIEKFYSDKFGIYRQEIFLIINKRMDNLILNHPTLLKAGLYLLSLLVPSKIFLVLKGKMFIDAFILQFVLLIMFDSIFSLVFILVVEFLDL